MSCVLCVVSVLVVRWLLFDDWCLLSVACCRVLFVDCRSLFVIGRLLCDGCCLLVVVCCSLFAVRCL